MITSSQSPPTCVYRRDKYAQILHAWLGKSRWFLGAGVPAGRAPVHSHKTEGTGWKGTGWREEGDLPLSTSLPQFTIAATCEPGWDYQPVLHICFHRTAAQPVLGFRGLFTQGISANSRLSDLQCFKNMFLSIFSKAKVVLWVISLKEGVQVGGW